MPNYVPYRDDIETIEPDEQETHAKIIEVMIQGQHISREKYGKSVRISHAKAHGLLTGELIVSDDLLPAFAQGLFQPGAKHPVLVRLATAPGEFTDDSKISTVRGMAIKVFNVEGPKLPPFTDSPPRTSCSTPASSSSPMARRLSYKRSSPTPRSRPSSPTLSRALCPTFRAERTPSSTWSARTPRSLTSTDTSRNTPWRSPITHRLPSATAITLPSWASSRPLPGCSSWKTRSLTPKRPMRCARPPWPSSNPMRPSSESSSNLTPTWRRCRSKRPCRPGARRSRPTWSSPASSSPEQDAFDPARADIVDGNFSFSPAHSLVAHRPLGGINRARLVAYTTMANLRRQENSRPTTEPTNIDQVPA